MCRVCQIGSTGCAAALLIAISLDALKHHRRSAAPPATTAQEAARRPPPPVPERVRFVPSTISGSGLSASGTIRCP
jgi:hypothetical protein